VGHLHVIDYDIDISKFLLCTFMLNSAHLAWSLWHCLLQKKLQQLALHF